MLSRKCVEYRRRGPVRRRRHLRRRPRPRLSRCARMVALSRHDRRRDFRRHGARRYRRLSQHRTQRQRDPVQPDADLCRAVSADLSGHRSVVRSAGFRLPADRDVLRRGAVADPVVGHEYPSRLSRRDRRLGAARQIGAGLPAPRRRPGAARSPVQRVSRGQADLGLCAGSRRADPVALRLVPADIVVLAIISRDRRKIRLNQPACLGKSFHVTA